MSTHPSSAFLKIVDTHDNLGWCTLNKLCERARRIPHWCVGKYQVLLTVGNRPTLSPNGETGRLAALKMLFAEKASVGSNPTSGTYLGLLVFIYLPIFIGMKQYNTKKSNSWEKSGIKPKNITQQEFIDICNISESMAHAASKLGLHFNTFKKYAINYGCYNTNQSGKGTKKNKGNVLKINELVSRAGIRRRIITENLIPYKCSECEISEWKGQKLSLHLDHIDGNAWNHELSNLRFLCPNCHSLTDTYTGKNK